MASPESESRLSQLVIPALEKIIKNAASWRKGHSKLVHQCKSLIDKLSSPSSENAPPDSPNSSSSLPGPLSSLSLADSESILSPLTAALAAANPKIADPALDLVQKLISHGLLHDEADPSSGPDARLLSSLIESVCRCHELLTAGGGGGDDAVELLVRFRDQDG